MIGQTGDADRAFRQLASLRLPTRRRILRAGWLVRDLAGQGKGLGLAEPLQWALRLPRRTASRIDKELAFQDSLTGLEWVALLMAAPERIIDDCRCSAAATGAEALARAAESRRPIILAPLHMGNYVHGIAWTMLSFFADRPLIVLYKRHDLESQTRTIGRIRDLGFELSLVHIDDQSAFLPAMRMAKQRSAVIAAFADLPPAYGSPADVTFFQRPMRLAVGVDVLARMTGGLVVPMANEVRLSGDKLHFGRPFESYRAGADERARVVEIMRRHVESAIIARPEQWHLWSRLDEYAPAPFEALRAGIEAAE